MSEERAERFRLDAPRQRFVATRSREPANKLLGQYLEKAPAEVTLEYATYGKPRLQPSGAAVDLSFNVAHSDTMGLLAFARGCEVGIDIERLRIIPHWREITLSDISIPRSSRT